MVEKADRSRVGDEPRADAEPASSTADREWDVFVREDRSDPLRHVGSVTAPDVSIAREQSARLFAWYAEDLWLCPADELYRFSTHELVPDGASHRSDGEPEGSVGESEAPGRESETPESADGSASDSAGPPVVEEGDVRGERTDGSSDGGSSGEGTGDDADEPRVTEL